MEQTSKIQPLQPDDLDSKSSLTIFHVPHAKKNELFVTHFLPLQHEDNGNTCPWVVSISGVVTHEALRTCFCT